MFPYLIAGAIGYAVAKIFEDETPKYADGGFIKIKSFKSNEGEFDVYDVDENHKNRADMFVVFKDKKGWVVRNVIVPKEFQRKGIATKFYINMNKMSLKNTGKPLHSTQTRKLSNGQIVHELSEDGIAFWDSLVRNGYAKKVSEKNYVFIHNEYADGSSVLLAPNGKPSNLTPEQYKLVRTPEFKAWFGDWENSPETSSKIVDENGEPLPVYHGSKVVNIQIFNTKLGTKTKSKMQLLFGTHFAQSIVDAEIYAKEKGKIYETFLSIKNPIDLSVGYVNRDDKNFQNYYSLVNDLKLAKNNKNVFDYDLFTDSGNYGGKSKHIQRIFITQNKLDQLSPKNVRDSLIKNNFDGVIYTPYQPVGLNQISNFSKSFIALHPEQIKLADGTNTTFDGNNPDIRYKTGGEIKDLVEDVSTEFLNSIRNQDKSLWNYDLEKSIEKQGILEPVTIGYWSEYDKITLIDGHHRLDTAIDLDIKSIPTIIELYYNNPIGKHRLYQAPKYNPNAKKPSDLGIFKKGGRTL